MTAKHAPRLELEFLGIVLRNEQRPNWLMVWHKLPNETLMSGFSRDGFHVLFNKDEYQYSFRGLKILMVAFLALHLLAAVLAPAAYKSFVWWNIHFPNVLNAHLASIPFPVYFDRIRLVLLVFSIPWLCIQCRLLSFRKLGYAGDFPWYSFFLRFYMIGLIWAVFVLGVLISVGALEVESSLTFWGLFGGLITAFLAALWIASLGELVFRSLLFRMFYTAFTPVISVVLSSMFFAYLHFKEPLGLWNYDTPPADVTWLDGFSVGFGVITGIVGHFDFVLFLNLTFVGYILTLVFLKTRSLWAAVGLHAGWVTPILLFLKIAVRDGVEPSLWWGSFRLVDGLFTTTCLLFFAFYYTRVYKARLPTGYS